MTISGQSALPKEDIDRMVRDAEQFAEEDRQRKEEADARNTADNLLYSTDKLLADSGDKVPEDVKGRLTDAQGKVRTALEGTDVASIQTATDELSRVSQEAGQALYAATSAEQSAQGGQGAGAGAQGSDGDDDIVDAEVVDDDTKEA